MTSRRTSVPRNLMSEATVTDAKDRQDIYDDLKHHWEHCLRCPLADVRCKIDDDKEWVTAPVPFMVDGKSWDDTVCPDTSKLHFLLSIPDHYQWQSGKIAGVTSPTALVNSPNRLIVQQPFYDLKDILPFGLEDTTIGLSFGCRPINFKNPRKVSKPKQQVIKACKARWVTELLLADPQLVMVCGRHALASIDKTKKTKFYRYVGEVIEFQVNGLHGPVTYWGYVAPDPEQVFYQTRDEGFDISQWDRKPVSSRTLDPYYDWCWHIRMATWIAELLHRLRNKIPFDSDMRQWSRLVRELNNFYDETTPVAELVSRVQNEINLSKIDPEDLRKAIDGDGEEEDDLLLDDDDEDDDEEDDE